MRSRRSLHRAWTASGDPLPRSTGSAKYEGDAAGVYVHKSLKADGSADVISPGSFELPTLLLLPTSVGNLMLLRLQQEPLHRIYSSL